MRAHPVAQVSVAAARVVSHRESHIDGDGAESAHPSQVGSACGIGGVKSLRLSQTDDTVDETLQCGASKKPPVSLATSLLTVKPPAN